VLGAQEVARDAISRSIDTRQHVLVALIERPGPTHRALREAGIDVATLAARARADLRAGVLDSDALAGIGIDLDAVRRQADAVFGLHALERAGRNSGGHIPFTSEAKKALELALREAIPLKQKSIGSSHLMLGILRGQSQPGAPDGRWRRHRSARHGTRGPGDSGLVAVGVLNQGVPGLS
jgi:ATP-dependent Clp protease ATP-binding subunit ClpA